MLQSIFPTEKFPKIWKLYQKQCNRDENAWYVFSIMVQRCLGRLELIYVWHFGTDPSPAPPGSNKEYGILHP